MKRTFLLLSLVAALAFAPGAVLAQTRKKPVTLESLAGGMRMMDFAGAPVWAPDGKRFVYRQGQTLMLYDVLSKAAKEVMAGDPLTAAAVKVPPAERFDWENRRSSEERIQWFPNGRDLLLINGGDLFVWHLETSKFDQLTATPVAERDAKLSPDAAQVAFRRGPNLFVLDIASKKITQLTDDGSDTLLNGQLDWVYPEELDLGTAFWWSPDSKRIGYLQFDTSRLMTYPHADLLGLRGKYEPQRYPQAGTPNSDVRLGVVNASGGGGTRWMDLGETRDTLLARVRWTPDSRSLAVQKFNRIQNRLDLLLAEVESATSRSLLRETDPQWVNLRDMLYFLPKTNQFLWSSERDGYNHLYLYSMDGKPVRQITRGDWEVQQVAGVSETGQSIYFAGTEVSPLERHLYRVGFDGKGFRRLTQTQGTHSISMSPTCDYYLDTSSSFTQPSRRTLHTPDGKEWAVFREADPKPAEEYELLPTEIVTLKAEDGTPLYARLVRPANFRPDFKYPVIVMVYGGPHGQAVRNSWQGVSWDQALAHKGFVIWQLDNRGTSGRGHQFEAKVHRRLGDIELKDQVTGVKHLVGMGFVDPKRVGIYGWSYGGYMTLYSMLNAPDTFSVGVAGAPVTDWRNYDTIYTERYMGLPKENADGYKASAPVTHAAKLAGKLMIVHNIDDDNVLFQNSMQMMNALQLANKPYQSLIYPQKSHGVMGPAARHMRAQITAFFEENLLARQ